MHVLKYYLADSNHIITITEGVYTVVLPVTNHHRFWLVSALLDLP